MKKWIAGIAGALMLITLAGCSSNSTVANMKGAKITKDEYYDAMKTSTTGGQATLRNLIVEKALEGQYGKKISDKAVSKQFNEVKANYKKSGASLENALASNNMTVKSFKKQLRTDQLLKAALRDTKKPTEKQLKKQWESYTPKITVQHILVANEAKAKDLIKQLEKDNTEKKFNELAKANSTDSATRSNGGKLSAFDNTDTSLDETFRKAALGLKKTGDFTKTPVKTSFGYHIIRAVKVPEKGDYKDHKKDVKDQVYKTWENDQAVITATLKKVLTNAKVSIKDKDLKDVLSVYLNSNAGQQAIPGAQQGN